MKYLALLLCLTPIGLKAAPLDDWIQSESAIALNHIQENISPAGTIPGVVIASPSQDSPNYYFHWIRDSALVMDVVLSSSDQLPNWRKLIHDFVFFSWQLQMTTTLTGLGEPRYNVDGSAYNGPWARPQNDGAALRTLTMFHALDLLPDDSASAPDKVVIRSVIQNDIEYILNNSTQPSFDLWEEVRGQHFYTHIMQMAALEAAIAHGVGCDNKNMQVCQSVHDALNAELESHWRADKKYFSVTLDRLDGAEKYKLTDLDIAVVLGALHSHRADATLSIQDDRILSTAQQLEQIFTGIFAINKDQTLAPAIGRYEGDVYFGGNPWYMTTAAFAELYYKLANEVAFSDSLKVTAINSKFFKPLLHGRKLRAGQDLVARELSRQQLVDALKARGDLFMARIQRHTPADGGLSEQFSRDNGFALSARDLTWSYASFLTAAKARSSATDR